MVRPLQGTITAVDLITRALSLKCEDQREGHRQEITVRIWMTPATRVTAAGRGLIPEQQLRIGQAVRADCIKHQRGRLVARTIEVLPTMATAVNAPR